MRMHPLRYLLIVSVYDSAARLLDVISEPTTLLVGGWNAQTRLRLRLSYLPCAPCSALSNKHTERCALGYARTALPRSAAQFYLRCGRSTKRPLDSGSTFTTNARKPSLILFLPHSTSILQPRFCSMSTVKTAQAHQNTAGEVRSKRTWRGYCYPRYNGDLTWIPFGDRTSTALPVAWFSPPVFLDGVNIYNTERVQVIMLDEKNGTRLFRVANRFRKADTIDVMLFSTKQIPPQARNQEPSTTLQRTASFLHTLLSAQMLAEAFNAACGRNHTADCGVGRKKHVSPSGHHDSL